MITGDMRTISNLQTWQQVKWLLPSIHL